MASTRCPPKSCAACSMCSFARRRAASASRICGWGSTGVAAAGGAGNGLAAGVAGGFFLLGAACVLTRKANPRINDAAARRPTILILITTPPCPDSGPDRSDYPIPHLHDLRSGLTLESERHAPHGGENEILRASIPRVPPFLKHFLCRQRK